MVESHDKFIMEFADKYGYNCSDEGADDEDEDDDDRGDAAAPPTAAPPPTPAPPNVAPEEIIKEKAPMEMVPEQEASEAHEVILAHAEIELPQPRLFNMIMSWMTWMTQLTLTTMWMSGSPQMEVMIGIESSSQIFKFRINNKSLGIV
jgi:hypothetical protein